LRFQRAAAWAWGYGPDPRALGLPERECRFIAQLRDQIRALGEDTAHVDYEHARSRDPLTNQSPPEGRSP